MRAKEFVINVNVPLNIKIGADGSVDVEHDHDDDDNDLDQNPIMVSPLQQEIELKKAAVGKKSPIINHLLKDEEYSEDN